MPSSEHNPVACRARHWCAWGCGVAVLLFGLTVTAVVVWGIIPARQAARRMLCHPDQLAFALEMYYEKHGHYPPACTVNEQGEPLHSWRTLLAVEFGKDSFPHGSSYATIRFDEPWDSEHNRLFHDKMPTHFFDCPEADVRFPHRKQNSYAHKMMIVEPRSTAARLRGLKKEDARVPLDEAIMVVESVVGVPWMSPIDMPRAALAQGVVNPYSAIFGVGSFHTGGFFVVPMSGVLGRLLPNTITADELMRRGAYESPTDSGGILTEKYRKL